MESLDIYDGNRNRTGRTVTRKSGEVLDLGEGEFIAGGGALLINSKGEILLSKRSMTKPSNPGLWELNGGCYLEGEEPEDAIAREVKEEIGINLEPQKGVLLKTTKTPKFFNDLWAFRVDIDIEDVKFTDGEVEGDKWASIDELISLREEGKMVDSNQVSKEDYAKALKLLGIETSQNAFKSIEKQKEYFI